METTKTKTQERIEMGKASEFYKEGDFISSNLPIVAWLSMNGIVYREVHRFGKEVIFFFDHNPEINSLIVQYKSETQLQKFTSEMYRIRQTLYSAK